MRAFVILLPFSSDWNTIEYDDATHRCMAPSPFKQEFRSNKPKSCVHYSHPHPQTSYTKNNTHCSRTIRQTIQDKSVIAKILSHDLYLISSVSAVRTNTGLEERPAKCSIFRCMISTDGSMVFSHGNQLFVRSSNGDALRLEDLQNRGDDEHQSKLYCLCNR